MTNKMIFDLPKDLIEEILSRLPLTSTRSMRLTCKRWNALSKSQSFLKMQLSKESEAGVYRSVVIMEHTLSLMNISKEEPSFKLVRLNQQAYRNKISQVLECQGLLLCILEEGTRFVLWNPYLGQTRWIEPRYCYHGNLTGDRFTYALGYADNNKTSSSSSCCRSHKILRLLDDYVPPLGSDYYFGKHFVWYEIYDVDSGQWTTLDYKTRNWHITPQQRGASIKGNTYWCASKRRFYGENNVYLVCFDFTKERFVKLMLLPFIPDFRDNVTLSCLGEDKLAVLLTRNKPNPYELDIWITTTKIEARKVDWIKLLTILDTRPEFPITTSGFFLDEEKKIAIRFDEKGKWARDRHILSIDGENGLYNRELDLGERVDKQDRVSQLCCYVPSLVQIKQLVLGKRKRQDVIEKRKYDERMMRLVQLLNPKVGKGSSKRTRRR